MFSFLQPLLQKLFGRKHANTALNVIGLAGPVVAGVISGGVFTAPVLISAATGLALKLAQSPITAQPKSAGPGQVADAEEPR